MVVAPVQPRPRGSNPDVYPEPDLYPVPGLGPDGPVVMAPGPSPAFPGPRPRLPGPAGQPDNIITGHVRPRRRRRRLATLAAVLSVTVGVGLLTWNVSPAAPRLLSPAAPSRPGRAQAGYPSGVIHMARARQQRRHQRIAQGAVDTITAGGATAAFMRLYRWPRTSQPQHGSPGLPVHGRADLTGINVLGWGCPWGPAAVAASGRYTWVTCGPGFTFELDAATGALVRVLAGPGYGFNDPTGIAADGSRLWVADAYHDSVTEFPVSSQ
jgi:hypothetical protein